jgi:hypothetical protein
MQTLMDDSDDGEQRLRNADEVAGILLKGAEKQSISEWLDHTDATFTPLVARRPVSLIDIDHPSSSFEAEGHGIERE